MAVNPLGMNQGTNSFIRFEDDGGTINTQVIDVRQGTVTLSNPTGTTTQFNNGTVDLLKAGTITKLEGGTLGLVTRVGNVGTLEVGTISTLPNIPGGTLGVVSSIANLAAGTVTRLEGGTLGRVSTVGTLEVGTISSLPNLPGGSIVVTAGTVAAHAITAATITEGTLRNLISGTINSATVVLNTGTISVLPNLPQGSINVTAGTVLVRGIHNETLGTAGTAADGGQGTARLDANEAMWVNLGYKLDSANDSVSAIVTNGTTRISVGTISAGTINTGTINAGTVAVTAGTLTAGTLKDNFGAIGTFTITVAALASSTVGVGRQSDLIDNTTNLYSGAIIGAQITTGSVTAANQLISLYLIRSDNGGGPIADDAAGTGDAAWTQANAPLLGNILIPAVGTAVQYKALFDTSALGHLAPKWGIGVVQSTGNNLHATAGSHSITYTPYNAKF
jgi:hypothetical protein